LRGGGNKTDDAKSMLLESHMRKENNFDPRAMAKAGRERAALELDQLGGDWVSAFEKWSHGLAVSREMNDLRAEFWLRNIEPPFDQIREALVAEVRKAGPDNPDVAQAVADFLNELEGPKH
jgi:hypothetical protein